jgi:hypothetical protein
MRREKMARDVDEPGRETVVDAVTRRAPFLVGRSLGGSPLPPPVAILDAAVGTARRLGELPGGPVTVVPAFLDDPVVAFNPAVALRCLDDGSHFACS